MSSSRSRPSRNRRARRPSIARNRTQTDFHANQHAIVESLANDGALKPELDTDTATDTLWVLNHPTLYHLLATERDWTPDEYEQWLGDLLCSQLLARRRRRTR
jgi:hypothetical protein